MGRMRAHAKLVHIGLANNDCSRILQQLHYRRIVGARKVLQDARGSCRLKFPSAYIVFDRDRLVIDGEESLSAGVVTGGDVDMCKENRRFDKRVECIKAGVFRLISDISFR